MALTSGERAALWRKRQREDHVKHEEYKRKERERNKKRKQSGEFKSINELSDRDKRRKRNNWRNCQRRKRASDKAMNAAVEAQLSPPASPEHVLVPPPNNSHKTSGRKKKNLNRSKAYRQQFKLRIELNKERQLKEKYKKRYYRLKNKPQNNVNEIRSTVENMLKHKEGTAALTLFTIIVNNIKRRYKHSTTNEKAILRDLIYREKTLKKYKLKVYAKRMFDIDNRNGLKRQRKKTIKCSMTRTFYEREDNSRLKAGKKSTITKCGQKKQIRFLNDSIKNIHKKYLFEKNTKVSYSLFASMKPFWLLRATEKDRETCLCKIHENPKLKVNKLYHLKMLNSRDLNPLIEDITCDKYDQRCMYRKCENCNDKKINTGSTPLGQIVEWHVWRTRLVERELINQAERRTVKKQVTLKDKESGTIETLLTDLQTDIERLCRHEFNINHQYHQMRHLKSTCNDNEAIVHIHFSENYTCKYTEEIQSMHFGSSKRQISIHTGVAYLKNKLISFATMSDCLKHGPGSIWAHLDPVLKHIKSLSPDLKLLHFLSDGPTTQYRNRTNFLLFSNKVYEYGFTSGGSWNFHESGHGKGAPDGIGAVVKRTADTLVNTTGRDITCAADLVNGLKNSNSPVLCLEVKEADISSSEYNIPQTVKAVPETMKLHQVVTTSKGEISSRILSYFCGENRLGCSCFTPVKTSFAPVITDVEASSSSTEASSPDDPDINVTVNSRADAVESQIPSNVSGSLQTIETVDEELIGRYVVVDYESSPYPGIVLSVDENDLEVKAMHRIGINRWFWSRPLEDVCWYNADKVITLLDSEPTPVTARHHQIDPEVWRLIANLYD